jgi:hypothetical protein
MGCVRCSGAVLSACRTISATALVAWAAGICEGELGLYCTLPPIIMRRMPGIRTKRANPRPFWADSRCGHGTSASQSGRRSQIELSIAVRTYM